MMLTVIQTRTAPGQNAREHWRAARKRIKAEKWATHIALVGKERPALPCTFLLRRVAPSVGLDAHDNLPGALKHVVDQVAEWMKVDDADPRIWWRYDQKRGPWAVEVEVLPHG